MSKISFKSLFLLTLLSSAIIPVTSYANSCKQNITENLCVYNRDVIPYEISFESVKRLQSRDCDEAQKERYVHVLNQIYDSLPIHTKSAFCHIRLIGIAPLDRGPQAFARRHYEFFINSGSDNIPRELAKMDGFALYLNKNLFEDDKLNETWSIKEYNWIFGLIGRDRNYIESNLKVLIQDPIDQSEISSLKSTIVHEVGHFLEFNNPGSIGYLYTGQRYFNTFIDPTNSEFSKYDWTISSADLNDFEYGFPIYSLNDTLINHSYFNPNSRNWYDRNNLFLTLTELYSSSVKSLYSLMDPHEDFAEFYLHSILNPYIEISFEGNKIIRGDTNEILDHKNSMMIQYMNSEWSRYHAFEPYTELTIL